MNRLDGDDPIFDAALALLLGITCMISGLVMLQGAANRAWQAVNSVYWPATHGRVVASKAVESVGATDRWQILDVRVEYFYFVNGQAYGSALVRFDHFALPVYEYAALAAYKYPRHQELRVFYNPDKPWQAVLEPGFRAAQWSRLGVSLAMVWSGAIGLAVFARRIGPVSRRAGIRDAATPLVALGLLAIGAAILLFGALTLREGLASYTWPTATGHVNTSRAIPGRASRSGSVRYLPNVRYTFYVKGQEYDGQQVRLADPVSMTQAGAQAFVERFARGSTVTVWYDPRTPERAVLEPGPDLLLWIAPLIGLLMMQGGAFLIAYRKDRSPVKQLAVEGACL